MANSVIPGSPEALEGFLLPWEPTGDASDGLPMARVGWRLQLFWRDPASPVKRQAMVAMAEEFLDMAEGRIRRYVVGSKEDFVFPAAGQRPDLSRLHALSDNDDDWVFSASAAIEPSEAEAWGCKFTSFRITFRADEYGQALVYLPVLGFGDKDAARKVIALFARWCSMVQADQAYGGLGWILPNALGSSFAALERIGPAAMRFEGLDTDYPNSTARRCREGVRWPTWLTAVSDRLLERAGGAQVIAAAAGPDITPHAYTGGTIFQAGHHPQVGDTTQGLHLPAYRAIAKALKPLRAKFDEGLFNAPMHEPEFQGMDESEASRIYTKRWTQRFDSD